ncbi:MAG: arcB 2 [Gammaproteobacteria bacterium]|jgi:PAS domain S-box-containing protein|nr:arcB 2 [Gammaproteobacteria bacterium]
MEDIGNMVWTNIANIFNKSPVYAYWIDTRLTLLGCTERQANLFGYKNPKLLQKKPLEQLAFFKQRSELGRNIKENNVKALKATDPCFLCKEIYEDKKLGRYELLTYKLLIQDNQMIIGLLSFAIPFDQSMLNDFIPENNRYLALQEIISNMPEHVYWKDKNGVYLGCNDKQANSLGLKSGSDIIGKTDFALSWNNEAAENFQKNDKKIMENGNHQVFEEETTLTNGQTVKLLSHKTPLKDKTGKVVGILGISTDITQQKKSEEELEQTNRMKTEFIANMSHDIRTPLTGILGMAEILESRLIKAEEKEFCKLLINSAKSLNTIFNEIIEVIKSDVISKSENFENFELKEVINDIIQLLLPSAKAKNIDISIQYGSMIPRYVNSNRLFIHRILLNLIGNAIKFTPAGKVTLIVDSTEIKNEKQSLKLLVKDTGIGIPEEQQNVIFERFVRLDPSYASAYKGVGLGLYMANQYVKKLGGKIYVDSVLGKGSQFTCLIPFNEPLLEKLDEQQRLGKCNLSSAPIHKADISKSKLSRILVVEDDLIAQKVARLKLLAFVEEVDIANSGEKALALCETQKYDLIFMDIGLPGINGCETTRKIREQEKNNKNKTPIVALTAHIDQDTKDECIQSGIDRVLNKPLLTEAVQEIFADFFGLKVLNTN